MIARQLEAPIRAMQSKFPILLVTGPRQAGKTTLLREMFKDYKYVNLEYVANREHASENPVGFLKKHDGRVIIEEAQRVPALFSYLQVKVDEDRTMGQYILAGSQNFLLSENVAQSLAGRVAIFKLLPLSHSELHNYTPGIMHQSPEQRMYYPKSCIRKRVKGII
jgi:predicted AAA+ superfamily ATPase